jgi:hypothetical protein
MDTPTPTLYQAHCHCGAVHFEVEAAITGLSQCNCSLCRKKNALMFAVHESKLRVLAGHDALTEYRFHTRVAQHFFCKVCGIYTFHRRRSAPDVFGVNVFCLDDFDPSGLPIQLNQGALRP